MAKANNTDAALKTVRNTLKTVRNALKTARNELKTVMNAKKALNPTAASVAAELRAANEDFAANGCFDAAAPAEYDAAEYDAVEDLDTVGRNMMTVKQKAAFDGLSSDELLAHRARRFSTQLQLESSDVEVKDMFWENPRTGECQNLVMTTVYNTTLC